MGIVIVVVILLAFIPIQKDTGKIVSYNYAYETVGSKFEIVCTYRVNNNYYTGIGSAFCLRAEDFYKREIIVNVTQTLLGAYVSEI